MPHWVIYHPLSTFQDVESKQSLAKAITSHYTPMMPAFYVVVTFIPVPDENMFVGGEMAIARGKPFVRICTTHIHIKLPEQDEIYRRTTDNIDKLLKPHIADKGYDWEYHIEESERKLWKINGFAPPLKGNKDDEVWMRADRAVAPEEIESVRKSLGLL
jgi:hypothetical protein